MIRSHHFSAILIASPGLFSWTETDFIALLKTVVQQAQLTVVGELAFTFEPQGISAVLLLAESHVALHFWQEQRKICIDIHICDYQQDNRAKAELLAELLSLQLSGSRNQATWNYLSVTG